MIRLNKIREVKIILQWITQGKEEALGITIDSCIPLNQHLQETDRLSHDDIKT